VRICTRKDGAPGIDGVTAADYATNLEANLVDLLDRIKSGRYKAPPVRRTYIPKTDGLPRARYQPIVLSRALTFNDVAKVPIAPIPWCMAPIPRCSLRDKCWRIKGLPLA
jgi:hypothetical protein